MKCDYCCNHGHDVHECPHLAAHLLDPRPRFNSLRSFIQVMQQHGVDVEPRVTEPQSGDGNGPHG
jgi:hypothetical protein